MIEQETLKELFDYDPETGNLINRRKRGGRAKAGSIVGSHIPGSNQVTVIIAGKCYQVRDLVWIYHHGEIPDHTAVPINGNPLDSRIENLKLQANIAKPKDYEPAAFLRSLADELDILNTTLIKYGFDDKTRIRMMRSFANLHKLPSKAKKDEAKQ